MADNVDLNAMAGGATVAADEIDGVNFQRIKLVHGADGVNGGDVSSANPLPVTVSNHPSEFPLPAAQVATLTPPEAITGFATSTKQDTIIGHVDGIEGLLSTIDADTGNLGGILTALEVIDDWDESNRAKVNPIVGEAGVQGGSGTVSNTTQRVVLATDVGLPAGANKLGTTTPVGQVAGGNSVFNSTDLDESEEQVKATAGTIYAIYVWNTTDAPLWLKVFNATAASVSVGSTSADFDIMIPANANSDGAGFVIPIPTGGWPLDTAITMAVTTGRGVTDSGAPATGAAGVMVFYA